MRETVKINLLSDGPAEISDPVKLKREQDFFAGGDRPPQQPFDRLDMPGRRRKGGLKKLLASAGIVIIIIIAVFSSSVIFSNEKLIKGFANLNFLSQIGSLIVAGDRPLQGEQDDRINFLLLGIGGAEHEGGTLADTMILGALKPSTKQVAMMSIPRDLYVKLSGTSWSKVNAISAYAEKKEPGTGGEAARKFIAELLGSDIQYFAVIDFDGFEKLIDEFGGIDVYVENDLIDYSYPIRGKENDWPIESRYEALNIKKGWRHFDGATALKYSRSRHALGNEGSDFARSKRQQKILMALKSRITQYNFLLNPTKVSSLLDAYQDNVSTNLQLWEILKLAKLAQDIDVEHPINYSLVDGRSPLLYDQLVNNSYVLLPYGGNFDKIGFVWQNIFTVGTSSVPIDYTKWEEFKDQPTSTKATTSAATTATTSPAVPAHPAAETQPFENEPVTDKNILEPAPAKDASYQNEAAKIEIQNGTAIEGWASREAARLRAKGFTVVKTGNAAQKNYASIKLYDFSGGDSSLTISELQLLYGVKAATPPAGLKSTGDILIILGK